MQVFETLSRMSGYIVHLSGMLTECGLHLPTFYFS